jgi:hypothetical protein
VAGNEQGNGIRRHRGSHGARRSISAAQPGEAFVSDHGAGCGFAVKRHEHGAAKGTDRFRQEFLFAKSVFGRMIRKRGENPVQPGASPGTGAGPGTLAAGKLDALDPETRLEEVVCGDGAERGGNAVHETGRGREDAPVRARVHER